MALKTENKENAILKEQNKKNEEITNFDNDLKSEAEEAGKLFGVSGLNPIKNKALYEKPHNPAYTYDSVTNAKIPSEKEAKRIEDYWNSPDRLNEQSFDNYSNDDLTNRYNNIVDNFSEEELDSGMYGSDPTWSVNYIGSPEMNAILNELEKRGVDTSTLKPNFGKIKYE